METKIKCVGKACGEMLRKSFILLFFSLLLSSGSVIAQSDEPSVENISKTLDAAKEMQRKEIMSYVFMVLGFSVVIAIAWFTNARVQKNRKDAIASNSNQQQAHKPVAHRRVAHRARR